MASGARTRTREEERRLSIRTLAIASVASATAAIVTSQFWSSGTPLAAALTPVIVAIVSELLHRPTERIVERFTADSPAVLPEAAGAAPPASPHEHPLPNRAPAEPGATPPPRYERGRPVTAPAGGRGTGRPPGAAPPMRVYRGRAPRRRFAVGVVALTALLAFVLAAAALTLPELIAGQSLGKADRHTTLFGGKQTKREEQNEPQQEAPTQTAPEDGGEQQQQQQQQQQPEQPDATTPEGGAPSGTQTQESPQGGASTTPASPGR